MYKINKIIRSKKFLEYFLITVVLLLGFVVRLYKIGNPIADWHSWRQADTASVSRIYVDEGIDLLRPRYYDISSIQSGKINPKGYRFVEFPFYNAIHATLYKTYPRISLEMWGRLLSVIAATISGYFIYLIGKRFLGISGGILSAFFYMFIPFNIYFTRVVLPEPIGILALLMGIWFFIKFSDNKRFRFLLISGISLSFALLVKPFFAFYLLPLIYITNKELGIVNVFRKRKLLFKFLLFALITFTPFVIWRIWESNYPEGIPFFEWAFNGDEIRFRPAFWRWIFGERLGILILGIWGLVPFVAGVLRDDENSKFIKYCLAGMLLYVVTVATANVRHDYYQIITIPAISLALAAGSQALWRGNRSGLTSRILLIFSVFMLLMMGWLRVRDFYQVNHPEIIEVGAKMDKIAPKDSLVVAPYNGDTAFLYHTKRFGWPAVDNSIDDIVAQGADFYVSVDPSSPDSQAFQKKFEPIEKTGSYIILDLHKVIKQK